VRRQTLYFALVLILVAAAASAQTFTYLDRANLARDADFRKRIEVAFVKVCLAALEEDPSAANHDQKVLLARRLLVDPEASSVRIAALVVNHASVTSATLTDGDLQTAVNQTLLSLATNNILTR